MISQKLPLSPDAGNSGKLHQLPFTHWSGGAEEIATTGLDYSGVVVASITNQAQQNLPQNALNAQNWLNRKSTDRFCVF